MARGSGAAHKVGYGFQIKSGTTDRGGQRGRRDAASAPHRFPLGGGNDGGEVPVAPDLIWGPNGGGRRDEAPSGPRTRSADGLGVWRCAQRWVWVPDQVWNDGQGAWGDSRSGAGMTEESPRRPRLDLGPKRRWSAGRGPERPANRVGGWLGGLALRTRLGMGSRSSLERRTEADRGGGGMRRPPSHRFPLGGGNDGGEPPSPQT